MELLTKINLDGEEYELGLTDSGWVEPTLTSNFENYGSSDKVKYRKVGNIVEIRGAVKPTNTLIGSTNDVSIFTLPSGYRPNDNVYQLQQGSGRNLWLLRVKPNGDVCFSRYGTNELADATTSTWLPFNSRFFIE